MKTVEKNIKNREKDRYDFVLLFATILSLIAFGYIWVGPNDLSSHSCRGLIAVVFVFAVVSMFEWRPVFPFPGPFFWRIVFSVSVIYLLILVYVLMHSVGNARYVLSIIDPTIGTPIAERFYANDCRLSWHNIMLKMDIFVVAHSLGYFVKAFLMRDNLLLWINSVGFEFLEYSLQHQLPNFEECWWDHWILDAFGCNWLGMWTGLKLLDRLSIKRYDWLSRSPSSQKQKSSQKSSNNTLKTFRQKVTYFADKLPLSWIWHLGDSPTTFKRWILIVVVSLITFQVELNAFYLKSILYLDVDNPKNFYRIALWTFSSAAVYKEFNQYTNDSQFSGFSAQTWIALLTMIVEVLICVKFSQGMFTNPCPKTIVRRWTLGLIAYVTMTCYMFPWWKARKPLKRN